MCKHGVLDLDERAGQMVLEASHQLRVRGQLKILLDRLLTENTLKSL